MSFSLNLKISNLNFDVFQNLDRNAMLFKFFNLKYVAKKYNSTIIINSANFFLQPKGSYSELIHELNSCFFF